MNFRSVVGKSPPVDFSTAVMTGLAPDGGLYVPEKLPALPGSFLDRLHERSLEEIACEVLKRFLPEFPAETISNIVAAALTFPIPLVSIDERTHLLELFHGPTLAFKDVGARFMSRMMSFILLQQQQELTVLVATSGDTGSAVAQGFFGVSNVVVFVLYPSGKISRLQEQQLTTLGGNIVAIELEGTFDDCQRFVKRALVDPELLSVRRLTSANSINLARLLPQIVYFVWAVAQWRRTAANRDAAPIVVVPSGNFGNLTAAVYAKWMGVPIERFVAATNVNNVVSRYVETGIYTPQPSISTLSNAMDVGDPSNLSRLRSLYGDDPRKMRGDIDVMSITDEETMHEIAETYRMTRYILDPHTAVGVAAARHHRTLYGNDAEYIIAATAHPAKFRDTIHQAIGIDIPLPGSLQKAMSLMKKSIKLAPEYPKLRELVLSRPTSPG